MSTAFLFDIELGGEPREDAMLGALTASILGHLGYSNEIVDETVAELRAELPRRATAGPNRHHLRFRGVPGGLEITLAYADGREWRIGRSLS